MGIFSRLGSLARVLSGPQPQAASADQEAGQWVDKGNACEEQGNLQGALHCYDVALSVFAGSARAHMNRGNALLALERIDEAIAAYEAALRCDPRYAAAHYNLASVHLRLGSLESAVAGYRMAVELKPDFVDAEVGLAAALEELNRYDEAILHYRRALAIKPDYAEVHSNLATVLRDSGRFSEALTCYADAIRLKPEYIDAYINAGNVYKDLGRFDEALEHYEKALQLDPASIAALSNLTFAHNYLADRQPDELLGLATRYGSVVAGTAHKYTHWKTTRNPDRKLRVGLVSADLRNHPVGYFVDSVLASLANEHGSQLDIVAYYNHSSHDAVSERIRRCCAAWRNTLGYSDAYLANQIHNDEIDILIDLSGHTGGTRLPVFAWKPAPIQASWLGYFASTGVAEVDYFIADPWTLPAADEAYFVEKIWRLPETRLCFTAPDDKVDVRGLPALENGYVTFGCFNNMAKINSAVVDLWANVLKKVDGSRLFLKSPQFGDAIVCDRVAAAFNAHGIEASRLAFEGLSSRAAYLNSYNSVDIALDPFPYPGGTTTVEALWMGVPVMTLAGQNFLARQGVGLLANAGLPDWIAEDKERYLARVAEHAADLAYLAKLRSGLREQVLASPIFDASRFAMHMMQALRGMWRDWCIDTVDDKRC